ncbi:hypothetical protein EV207_102101 [Scopulibacillus darangshiensis]|uniref:Beta-lactamase superfamily II metal-dependent hydrolase n=1 Tax=Scopulibacillus darangshiensis TaxID=442528 RepID=A0A4R2PBV4_9BACL|nr:hypothetical protein [Scopulibacillus darangshiensis]TCP31611.1 hypothetical protein EV207_102101 [Scopulibacillus darangshiensis]
MKKLIFLAITIIFVAAAGHVYSKGVPLLNKRVKFFLEHDEIAVTFLALPDGEATLAQTASNQNILINTGSKPSYNVLREELKIYGVTHINDVIITKNTEPYMGNIIKLVKNYNVNTVITSKENIHAMCLKNSAIDCSIFTVPNKSDFRIGQRLNIHILNESAGGEWNLLLTYGKNHIYYMSNRGTALHLQNPYSATVLKVPDFGRIEVNNELVEKIDPEIAIVFRKEKSKVNSLLYDELEKGLMDIYEIGKIGNVTIKMNPFVYEVITVN